VIDAASDADVDGGTDLQPTENKRPTDLAATGYGGIQNAQNAQARDAGAAATIERDKANRLRPEAG
jgi:membrane fusion protein (multidrug efflux system)